MRDPDEAKACGGFTLVELLIALVIATILLSMSISTFRGLNEKYRVESETKQLYTDLMDARARAMQRSRAFFFVVSGNGYATYEDTFTVPDGNGTLDTGSDTRTVGVTGLHTIVTQGLPGAPPGFVFDRNGIASVTGNIRFTSSSRPDYDCITILPTRIKMGQYNGVSCIEK